MTRKHKHVQQTPVHRGKDRKGPGRDTCISTYVAAKKKISFEGKEGKKAMKKKQWNITHLLI